MPILGYGCYKLAKKDTERCITDALEVGYRMFDTAKNYGNEEEIGKAVKASGIAREDLFLTSKVWINDYHHTEDAVNKTMEAMGTDYMDLMLLHHPLGRYLEAWEALEKMYEDKKIRAIGVANFKAHRLVDLAKTADHAPMVDQLETHPFLQQVNAKEWTEKYKCVLMAWGPFGEGHEGLFSHPVLQEVANKYGKSIPQIILRWNIQRGIAVAPKTEVKSRMEENFDVFDFELEKGDLIKISEIDEGRSLFMDGEEPDTVEWLMAQPPVVQ